MRGHGDGKTWHALCVKFYHKNMGKFLFTKEKENYIKPRIFGCKFPRLPRSDGAERALEVKFTKMSANFLARNMAVLSTRFPRLAEKVKALDMSRIAVANSGDGGICYAERNDNGEWIPISNHKDPIATAQAGLDKMAHRLKAGLSPAVVIGLYPGYILESVYRHFEGRVKHNEPFRHIYVIVDSIKCLAGWLKESDRTEILGQEEVLFLWHEEVGAIVRLCEENEQRSHLFIPVSSLSEMEVNRIIEPLAELYLRRQAEERRWREENRRYYDGLGDAELAETIQGRAGRRPRLLMPTHLSSTVVQFSTRDVCAAFEKMGWEFKILKMERDLSSWLTTKTIYEFKPDLLIFINHLRTEDPGEPLYPDNMAYVTWIQDTLQVNNNHAAAARWNLQAGGRRRDCIVGYVDQLFEYGYAPERLRQIPMIVDTEIFKPVWLTPAQKGKYSCDICFASNNGKESGLVLEENLLPFMEAHGFSRKSLCEVHEQLWDAYRRGESYIDYKELELFLRGVPSFADEFSRLGPATMPLVVRKVFWSINNTVYRHSVLEWIDEMARSSKPHLRVHVYGGGWDAHPRFSRYARGKISHGKDLNLAYNGARFCLHLNPMEGVHQRFFEVFASGGNVLTRTKNSFFPAGPGGKGGEEALRDAVFSFVLNNAMDSEIKYYCGDISRLVLRMEYHLLYRPDCWTAAKFNTREELSRLLEEPPPKRMMPWFSVGNILSARTRCEEIVRFVLEIVMGGASGGGETYSLPPQVVRCVTLASLMATGASEADVASCFESMEGRGVVLSEATANYFLRRKNFKMLARMMPKAEFSIDFLRTLFLQDHADLSAICDCVGRAVSGSGPLNANEVSILSQLPPVGDGAVLRERVRRTGLDGLGENDAETAFGLAVLGLKYLGEAEGLETMREALERYPAHQSGEAIVAFEFLMAGEVGKSLRLFEREAESGRQGARSLCAYSICAAIAGDAGRASLLQKEAGRRLGIKLRDGFSRAAWFCLADGRTEDAEALLREEFDGGNPTWRSHRCLAAARARVGRVAEAERIVEAAYSENERARNMYSAMAFALGSGGAANDSGRYLKMDSDLGRHTPPWDAIPSFPGPCGKADLSPESVRWLFWAWSN